MDAGPPENFLLLRRLETRIYTINTVIVYYTLYILRILYSTLAILYIQVDLEQIAAYIQYMCTAVFARKRNPQHRNQNGSLIPTKIRRHRQNDGLEN